MRKKRPLNVQFMEQIRALYPHRLPALDGSPEDYRLGARILNRGQVLMNIGRTMARSDDEFSRDLATEESRHLNDPVYRKLESILESLKWRGGPEPAGDELAAGMQACMYCEVFKTAVQERQMCGELYGYLNDHNPIDLNRFFQMREPFDETDPMVKKWNLVKDAVEKNIERYNSWGMFSLS